jgi:hypothetical protein
MRARGRAWTHHLDNPVGLLDTALAAAGCIAVTLLVAVLVLISTG